MGATTMGIMALTSAAVQGISSYQQAKSQASAMKANAGILEQNARQTRLEGALNEDVQRRQNRQELSKLRAAMGEMGIGDSATAIGSLAQDASNAEQNALNIRYKTETAANSILQQASDLRFNAKQTKKQGKNAFFMGMLSGAANGYGAYQRYSTPIDYEGIKKYGLKG